MRLTKPCIFAALSFALALGTSQRVQLAFAAESSPVPVETSDTNWLELPSAGYELDLSHSTIGSSSDGSAIPVEVYIRLTSASTIKNTTIDFGPALSELFLYNTYHPNLGDFYKFSFHITNASGKTLNYVDSSYRLFKNYDVDEMLESVGNFHKEGSVHNASELVSGATAPDGSPLHYGNLYTLSITQSGPLSDLFKRDEQYSVLVADQSLAELGFSGPDALINYLVAKTHSLNIDDLSAHPERVVALFNTSGPNASVGIINSDYSEDYGQALKASSDLVFDGAISAEDQTPDSGVYSLRITHPTLATALEKYVTTRFFSAAVGTEVNNANAAEYPLIALGQKNNKNYQEGNSYLLSKVSNFADGSTADIDIYYGFPENDNHMLDETIVDPAFSFELKAASAEPTAQDKADSMAVPSQQNASEVSEAPKQALPKTNDYGSSWAALSAMGIAASAGAVLIRKKRS